MGAENKKFNISRQSLSALCLFAAALAFMLWKCRYGLGGSDEAFYLTVPHRLCLGDELFRDEWHLSQLSSFLTLPFVWLYRLIKEPKRIGRMMKLPKFLLGTIFSGRDKKNDNA